MAKFLHENLNYDIHKNTVRTEIIFTHLQCYESEIIIYGSRSPNRKSGILHPDPVSDPDPSLPKLEMVKKLSILIYLKTQMGWNLQCLRFF